MRYVAYGSIHQLTLWTLLFAVLLQHPYIRSHNTLLYRTLGERLSEKATSSFMDAISQLLEISAWLCEDFEWQSGRWSGLTLFASIKMTVKNAADRSC